MGSQSYIVPHLGQEFKVSGAADEVWRSQKRCKASAAVAQVQIDKFGAMLGSVTYTRLI